MRKYVFATAVAVLTVGTLSVQGAHAAPTVTAYALSAAGESILGGAGGPFSCATFGPDSRTAGFQGVFQVGLPTESPCGVGEDSRIATAASGGVSVSSNLAVSFGASPDLRSFVGGSTGVAGFGSLGVAANATYNGIVDPFTVLGSQAFALQTEPMNFGGAVGQGFYQPTFTVDGSMFNVGRTDSQIAFFYGVGANVPAFLGFRIQNNRGDITFYGPNGYVPVFPGMSLTGDLATGFTVAGSTTFTLNIPVTFGVDTEITYALWAGVLPSSTINLLTASESEVSYANTFKLTGITVIGPNGQPLNDFTITSGSGTLYDSNGAHAVPEPSTLALTMMGLVGAALHARRPRHRD